MAANTSRNRWGLRALLAAIILAGTAIFVSGPFLTRYVEGDSFRKKIGRSTSKGLKIEGQYETIRRTGLLTAATPGFRGGGGEHTMKSLEAEDIEADFNPYGFFLKRWQFDEIRIRRGTVELQKTEGVEKEPERSAKPWYRMFLPDRTFLKRTRVQSADVLWMFRGKRAGIYGLKLLIRPNERDFEYWGEDGALRMSCIPELRVERIHTLIRKPRMYLYETVLVPPGPQPRGTLELHGEAGLREDRIVRAEITFHDMPVAPWLPDRWRPFAEGAASGRTDWHSNGTRLEGSSAGGRLEISGARLHGLRALKTLASLTKNKAFLDFRMEQVSMNLDWQYPRLRAEHIAIESRGLFRIEGTIEIEDKALRGKVELGITHDSLTSFPGAEKKIFTRKAGSYFWTTVRLSGDMKAPTEDLSPRLTKLLWDSPGSFFKMLFRMLGEWFKGLFE